jgi:PAS domain S-box-containing protein
MIASLEDITSQIKSDEELVLAARRQLLLFHKSPTPKWIVDAGSIRFIEVNDAAVKHYGFTREEFKQMIIYDLIAPEERKRAKLLFEKLKETENYEYNGILKLRKKKGAVVDAEVTSHTLKIDGETHVMVVANDITDRLNAQKRNTQAIIEAQEEERNLIGKELHDNVNQLLTTAQLYLENIDDYGDHTEEFINKSIDIIRKSISEIRNLSKALITPDLIDFDFRDSLEGLISYYKYLKTFDITFNYNVSNNYFPSEMRLNIYRILQELLNNTVKYAKATLVTISVEETDNTLVIRYEDNGVGFDPEAKSTGIGIRNIKSRIDAFKGEITFDSALDKGLRVLIKLPFL